MQFLLLTDVLQFAEVVDHAGDSEQAAIRRGHPGNRHSQVAFFSGRALVVRFNLPAFAAFSKYGMDLVDETDGRIRRFIREDSRGRSGRMNGSCAENIL